MDDARRKAVERRAYELWNDAGRPAGRDLDFWLEAERPLGNQPAAGEEDPLSALDEIGVGEGAMVDHVTVTDAELRAAVEDAVPWSEQLPRDDAENPIVIQVRDAAAGRDHVKR